MLNEQLAVINTAAHGLPALIAGVGNVDRIEI